MLLIVVFVAIATLVSGLAVAVNNHYQKQNKNNQVPEAPLVLEQVADERVAEAIKNGDIKYQALVVQYNDVLAECQKGLVAYDQLTLFAQTQLEKPVCPEKIL